jgi:hypothetical protein
LRNQVTIQMMFLINSAPNSNATYSLYINGAMILSLCAFSLTQPIDISERPTSSSRSDHAKVLVNEATRMRTSSDFGEHPSIEAVLTSFFLFGYLFGSNQHNAARRRLREAIDLASTLGLNNPATYSDRSTEEKGPWLRTYLVLSVRERYYFLAYIPILKLATNT